MAISSPVLFWLLCMVSSFVDALIPPTTRLHDLSKRLAPIVGKDYSTFEQLLDHSKGPKFGTFSQFYYYSAKHWAGPGSPIVLTTPGEISARGYDEFFKDRDLYESYAKQFGAAIIILEHRYWGRSSPFANLTADTLQYLTLDNAIADLTYFANNVKLPFDPERTSQPSKAAWILSGISYAGALTAWTAKLAPGTFWAYDASSAPVEAISDFWQYFSPINEYMPRECHQGLSGVIEHVDETLQGGDAAQIASLKSLFGLEELQLYGDIASALAIPIFSWQYDIYDFDQFCRWIETGRDPHTRHQPTSDPVTSEIDKALNGYAAYMKQKVLRRFCQSHYGASFPKGSVGCLRSDNSTSIIFTDTSVDNGSNRQWIWMLCNEPFGWFQVAAPPGSGSTPFISRYLTTEYYQGQCLQFFPGATFGSAEGKTTQKLNARTGGWTAQNTTRLLYVNGEYDPWKEAGVSSAYRPGGPLDSTDQVPVLVIPKGDHGGDLFAHYDGTRSQSIVVDQEIKQMKRWIDSYPAKGYHYHSPSASSQAPDEKGAATTHDYELTTRCVISAALVATVCLL